MKMPILEDAKRYIYSVDFSNIISKLVAYEGWKLEEALSVSQLYRNFLFLKRKYGKQYPLPPSKEIDKFWHNHILDTQRYHIDCLAIFGEYLHHYPYFGIDNKTNIQDLEEAFSVTQMLHNKEFGSQLYQIRAESLIKKAFIRFIA